jgi:hypothetical protein
MGQMLTLITVLFSVPALTSNNLVLMQSVRSLLAVSTHRSNLRSLFFRPSSSLMDMRNHVKALFSTDRSSPSVSSAAPNKAQDAWEPTQNIKKDESENPEEEIHPDWQALERRVTFRTPKLKGTYTYKFLVALSLSQRIKYQIQWIYILGTGVKDGRGIRRSSAWDGENV